MKRDPYFDNAKAVLIVLVVLGHTLARMVAENEWILTIYLFVFSFHMPAFILVSGYFSKKIKNKNDIWVLIKKILIPYIIFQVIYTFYYQKLFDEQIEFTILTPRWALWFLISLFCWNILLLIFSSRKYGIIFSIIVSLIIGYVGEVNEWLSLSRTFFFFPFFLVGHFLEEKHFEWVKKKKNALIGWGVLGLIFTSIYFYGETSWREWFYGRVGYKELMEGSVAFGFIYKLFLYLFMGVATYCFLCIVPRKHTFFTEIGSITLVIYLFHMFVLKYVYNSFIYEWIKESGQYYVLLVIPVLIIFILSRKPIVKVECLLIGIKMKA
ncbi:acyltransferase family protein [Peribacillus huizhouensis]|uniref:Fucose 4-O-acetylase-like acetyltransferase n=1 Tax=Peribacillus huizhouensis TaxID=1501239 RepID=A0ABR6CUZ1_9BACI|nr:acyltransferase family protein [Peribacillus huizhouensis]MBA9028825.1 fucose 4-O-acetylase-like acetyltransferase [Peribacillus huizhouensis]